MRGWETKQYVLSGVLAALTFAVAFLLGAGLIVATGIPATGGIANIFAAVLILVIGVKLVPRFGFATLTLGLMFTFAIPTMVGGPPGIYKVLNGIVIGIVVDVILLVGRYTRPAYVLAGSVGAVTSIVSIYAALTLLRLPGVERLAPLLIPLAFLQAILGALAAWVGVAIFDQRLSRLSSVSRLMAEPSKRK